jgi:hypothetical protein
VLICCVDGLTGFPEAIEAVFPPAWVQTCIVHQIRASLRYVNYRDRGAPLLRVHISYTGAQMRRAFVEVAPQLAFFHTHHGIGCRFDPGRDVGTQMGGGRPKLAATPGRST